MLAFIVSEGLKSLEEFKVTIGTDNIEGFFKFLSWYNPQIIKIKETGILKK